MSRTMYLVIRRALNRDGVACDDQSGNDTGSRVPLRLFGDRTAADKLAAQLSAEARRTMNPFPLLTGYLTSDIQKQLAALELPLDCPDDEWHDEWRSWWDLCQDLITDDQRAAVWAILGTSPPYEVLTLEVEDV